MEKVLKTSFLFLLISLSSGGVQQGLLICPRSLSQYDSFELMASWSAAHGRWLIEHLNLQPLSRMPSHDTFRHLFPLLQPRHLESFVRAAASAVAGPLDHQLVLIDGKALCGTWNCVP